MLDEPQVTYLTDAQAAELAHLHTTRSIECGAMTTHLMCSGCDGGAMDGGGPCQHDCHGLHHRYDPGRGIVCGDCGGTSGSFGPEPRWWTCGACRLEAPVDDIELIPGMAITDVEALRRRAHMLAQQGKDAFKRGLAAGRREAFEYELAQSEGCAAALDTLPGQQQAAWFYRTHAEHVRAVLAQEAPEGGGR